jgi:hypothetical protein
MPDIAEICGYYENITNYRFRFSESYIDKDVNVLEPNLNNQFYFRGRHGRNHLRLLRS